MLTRRTLLASTFLATLTPAFAVAQEPIHVTASFSILGDMIEQIGGERVEVTTLVGADGDAHVFQPSPSDARAIAEAQLFVINGLNFEGWIDRLTEASGYQGPILIATETITPITLGDDHDEHGDHGDEHGEDHAEHDHDDHDHAEDHAEHDHDDHDHAEEHAEHDHDDHDHGEDHAEHDHDDHDHGEDHAGHDHHGHDHGGIDPHAWQSLANAKIYANNIAHALADLDPEGAATYEANLDSYLGEIDTLEAEYRTQLEALPEDKRTVVTAHDAFAYMAEAYDLTFLAPQGITTESDPSAGDVAELIRQIREQNISAIFVENITDPRLLEQIADETDVTIGGTLYPGSLSGPDGPAPTYLDMMRHNLQTITSALSS